MVVFLEEYYVSMSVVEDVDNINVGRANVCCGEHLQSNLTGQMLPFFHFSWRVVIRMNGAFSHRDITRLLFIRIKVELK